MGYPCDVFNKIVPYYVIKFKFICFYFQPGKNLLSARQYRIDWKLPLMPCSNSPTALLCCMWGQRNGSNARNLKPASAASWSFKRGNAVENRDFMCYNFSIALDSRFGKESTMGKSLKRKECGKGIRQRKDGLYSARCYTKDGERRENTASRCPKPSKRTPQPPALCSTVGNRAAHGWLIGLIGAAINWEKRTLTVKNEGDNPKIRQHKITIIKENFGIWN